MFHRNDGSRAVSAAQSIINGNCEDDILRLDTSDGGNADAFASLYGDSFLYVEELGWLHWNDRYYEHDEGAIMLAMRESFDLRHDRFNRCGHAAEANQTKRNTYKLNAAIEQAKSMLRASIEEFDKNPDELNVANGVLNLKTWELVPHNPEQRFTYCVKAPLNVEAGTKVIDEFMGSILTEEGEAPNDELVSFVQEALGMSLTGHTREEKIFY